MREGRALTEEHGGPRNEGDEITVGRDAWLRGGLEIADGRGFGHQSDTGGGRTRFVEDAVVVRIAIKDVNAIYAGLNLVGGQVGGSRFEHDITAIGADGGELAAVVALDAGRGVYRNAAGYALLHIADKDVTDAVGVARDEITGLGLEDHVAAVGGKLGIGAGTVGTGCAGADRNEAGGSALDVAQVNIGNVGGDGVGVQLAEALESDVLAVAGDSGVIAEAARL